MHFLRVCSGVRRTPPGSVKGADYGLVPGKGAQFQGVFNALRGSRRSSGGLLVAVSRRGRAFECRERVLNRVPIFDNFHSFA